MMWNTSATGRPNASACVQSVSLSATAFHRVTRPCESVASTPSPMELSKSTKSEHTLAARSFFRAIRDYSAERVSMTQPEGIGLAE